MSQCSNWWSEFLHLAGCCKNIHTTHMYFLPFLWTGTLSNPAYVVCMVVGPSRALLMGVHTKYRKHSYWFKFSSTLHKQAPTLPHNLASWQQHHQNQSTANEVVTLIIDFLMALGSIVATGVASWLSLYRIIVWCCEMLLDCCFRD
jgi:hypothetical protein